MTQLNTYTVRLKSAAHGVMAFTTAAATWTQAVAQVLEAEGAPSSTFANVYRHIEPGEEAWNGATINQYVASAYNRVNDHIHAWEALGKPAPEHLLNGRHNLLRSVCQ